MSAVLGCFASAGAPTPALKTRPDRKGRNPGVSYASGDPEPSRDGATFFARRIIAFSPDLRRRRFHVPLRRCDFYDDRALCRDVRRNLELWLDSAALHTLWDRTWNQWKHLLGTKIEVEGTFVQSGKYRKRRGEWELVTLETALPSRLEVKLPPDFQQQIESAKTAYHRFGQYSRALDQIRLR